MVRRRSPPRYDTTIPEGWTAHDGKGRPATIDPYSRPAVMFRSGVKLQIGKRDARDYETWSVDPWTWSDRPHGMDIVAYKPEPRGFVRIERLDAPSI